MRIFALIFILLLSSCVNRNEAPSNQEDACSILDQRRGWLRDLQKAEANWGVPVHVQMAIIWKESSFRSRARTRQTYFLGSIPRGRISTAFGYSQALDGTWDWYQEETGRYATRRDNFAHATDFIGWYTDMTERKLGIAKSDAYNQYLAYHEGHAGYANGNYNSKSWLVGVANEVQAMANRYESQLQTCP